MMMRWLQALAITVGSPLLLKGRSGDGGGCGLEFKLGEEAVYFVYAGEVSLCDRVYASAELLAMLREYKGR